MRDIGIPLELEFGLLKDDRQNIKDDQSGEKDSVYGCDLSPTTDYWLNSSSPPLDLNASRRSETRVTFSVLRFVFKIHKKILIDTFWYRFIVIIIQ